MSYEEAEGYEYTKNKSSKTLDDKATKPTFDPTKLHKEVQVNKDSDR